MSKLLVAASLLLFATASQAQEATPEARLRDALQAARESGRLAELAGERFLISDRVGWSYELKIEEARLVIEDTFRKRRHHAPLQTRRLELNATGEVVAFSAGVWIPAANGAEVHARVEGESLRWEVVSTRGAGDDGQVFDSGNVPWTGAKLPELVTDVLWPLLSDDGPLACTRVSLSPRLLQEDDQRFRSGEEPESCLHEAEATLTRAQTAAGARVELKVGDGVTTLDVQRTGIQRWAPPGDAAACEGVSKAAFWEALDAD